jgi:uncharacterized protein
LFVLIAGGCRNTGAEILEIYPRHKTTMDEFVKRGDVVGTGPFTDAEGGNMALFRTRDEDEEFARADPFLPTEPQICFYSANKHY